MMRLLTKYRISSILFLIVSASLTFKVMADVQKDLFWAIEDNNLKDVARLLEKGANPDIPSSQGYTPLMIAAQKKNYPLAQLLINAGANLEVRNKYGETAIMLASYYGLTDMVKQLYIKGAEINHSGWNSLIYAATNGHTRTIQLLLNGGANINSTSDNGSTALMMAVRGNHFEAVKLLLENGADPAIKNELGDNALHWALKRNHQKIADFLRIHGAQE